MLIRFKFQNYRSFRDENILSMEAKGNSEYKNCLIPYKKKGHRKHSMKKQKFQYGLLP